MNTRNHGVTDYDLPDSAEILRLVRRGKQLRAEAIGQALRSFYALLRDTIAKGREDATDTGPALGSKA